MTPLGIVAHVGYMRIAYRVQDGMHVRFSAMKMNTTNFSETLVNVYQAT
jgi:hypothetical protein